jgi:hypothetical protein
MNDEDRPYFRDTWLKILTVCITGFIGAITTTQSNPRFDNTTIIWLVLIVICVSIWSIINGYSASKRSKFVGQDQFAEFTKNVDKQFNDLNDNIRAQKKLTEKMIDAQQQTMRTQLIHNAEKYLTRGWITSEELQSWTTMYASYETLGLNGFIESYLERINELPIKDLNDVLRKGK